MWISSPSEGNYVRLPSTLEIRNESKTALPLVRIEVLMDCLQLRRSLTLWHLMHILGRLPQLPSSCVKTQDHDHRHCCFEGKKKKKQQASSSSPTEKRREGWREEMVCVWISIDLRCGVEVAILWPTNTKVLVSMCRYRTLRVLK